MKKEMLLRPIAVSLLTPALFVCSGCAMFRASTHEVDVGNTAHMRSADYDFSDMRNVTQSIVNKLIASPFLIKQEQPPIFMIAGMQNRTAQYVDTKNLTDRVRTLLFESGKVQFINESRREDLLNEQGYQAANATPETQVAVGRQLGARYMLSGSLVEMRQDSPRQARVSRQVLKYYKLTFEVTDLETGLLAWTTDEEFSRQESLPLVGW